MRLCIYLGLAVMFSPPVNASELVHRFVDPSFGGNPLNGNFLMNQAGDQNATQDKIAPVIPKNALQDFTDRLKSSIFSALTRSVSGQLIDANTGKIIPNNTINVGDFSIVVGNEVNGSVSISVSDGITSTELTVPNIGSQ